MRRNLSENTMSSYSGEKPKYCSSSTNKKGHSWFECSKGSFGKGSFNNSNNKRLLVVINVLGSAGPLKFVVNEEDFVGGVIDTSLKLYAKERRLPVLGSDSTNFLLYCANAASDALSPWDEIGSCGGRSFVLCKKPEQPTNMTEARSQMISQKRALSPWDEIGSCGGRSFVLYKKTSAANKYDPGEIPDDFAKTRWELESLANKSLTLKI